MSLTVHITLCSDSRSSVVRVCWPVSSRAAVVDSGWLQVLIQSGFLIVRFVVFVFVFV